MLKLREIRKNKSMTQKAVSEMLNCSTVVYSRYETGARQPSIETLLQLSEIFGVSVDELLGVRASSSSLLSDYEKELISAARSADNRARADALAILRIHSSEDSG